MTAVSFLRRSAWLARALVLATSCAAGLAHAAEFSVTPIRVELKPGVMSETINVVNHSQAKLRVNVKLMAWSQDATGADVYIDSAELIYFPRQLEIPADSKRLVRVGVKTPAGVAERTFRLFIEEEPEPAPSGGQAQVAFHFRFGVPIFVTPAVGKPQPEVGEPTLEGGKVSLVVKNNGNQHFRLNKLTVSDGATFTRDLPGWYSLAGTQRTYSADLPREVCRKGNPLTIQLEGDGIQLERKLTVDPARCA